MRALLALIATVLLAAPVAARAASEFEVRGGGFGHGVGMSQYGAYGQALEGVGYHDILSHYYRGTEIGTVAGERVRVLLQASAPEPAKFAGAVKVAGTAVDPDRTYKTKVDRRGRLVVRERGGDRVGRFAAPLTVRGDEPLRLGGVALNGVADGRYRGELELRPGASGGITVVNDVGIDDYVRGVVAQEMPPSWHADALRAQAVAARSYALATSAGGPVFDLYPDTRSQVYDGVGGERPSTDAATSATAGEVVLYRGSVATTLFSSTSGGHTEHVENVFGGEAVPYLRGVPDPHDDISPLHRWRYRYSRRELESSLGGLVEGRFRRLRVLERGVSPKIVRAKVIGSEGRVRVSGATLRSRLGTPAIPYRIVKVSRTESSAASSTTDAPPTSQVAGSSVPLGGAALP